MKEIAKTILYSWKDRELPEIIQRDVDLSEYSSLKPPKIIAITGFRRSGKTYLLLKLIQSLFEKHPKEKVVYINFEDERIPLKTEFLTEIMPAVKEVFGEPRFLFLDEVQVIDNWSKWLRRVYDSEPRTRFFVTGSTSKVSGEEIPSELRGRFLEVHIYPLNFREFLRFKGIGVDIKNIEHSENKKSSIIKNFNEYLEYGGLPEVVLSPESKKLEIVQSYYNTVVKKDIIEKFKVRNEEGMKALLRLLLNSTRYTISKTYNTLKSLNYEIGKTTIQEYISHIESSYFIYSLPILSYKIKDEMQYPRKVYFIDNSFLFLSSKFSKNKGRLYENLVFVELKRRGKNIAYWLSKQKEEVDFAVTDEFKVKQLIQVCVDLDNPDTKKREIRALIKASAELKCNKLFVITEYLEKQETIKSKTIKYIPLWKWLLET